MAGTARRGHPAKWRRICRILRRVEALRQGTLDIVFMSEPWISRAQESGAGALWLPAADIAPSFPLGVLAFGPSLLEGTATQRTLPARLPQKVSSGTTGARPNAIWRSS
ncbi:MAG: hypothetical protein R2856_37570 [Caldilineaceae bacterium]